MWANRPVGQLEKCAEAGALRRAFPEEIGNELTAEEMAGQRTIDGAAQAPEKPKPESVTPPSARGGAQAAPAARAATTVPNRTGIGRASEPFADQPKTIPKSPTRPLTPPNEEHTDAVVSETPHLSLRHGLVG